MSESLCAICEISAARVLRKDEGGFVAVPDDCVRPGHVMVVSARHEPSFAELSANDRRAYMSLVAETAAAVEKATGAERCYAIRIGDKFRHLHFHLVPRMDGEDGLAPFVFGDGGWRKGIRADATPPAELVEQAIAADLEQL
jgi:diadenosine tetraphosphate (Ap4A) HIT family hydrolase